MKTITIITRHPEAVKDYFGFGDLNPTGDLPWAVAQANAEFIVRAVNAHDELVNLLETILDVWDRKKIIGPMMYHEARAAIERATA